jgi:archaeosine-15-forming tRNA-guanine transglycosylase
MWTDHRQGFRATRRGEQAIEAFREADKIDQLPWQVPGDEVVLPREAEKFRAVGAALLEPTGPVQIAHGEAISPDTVTSGFENALIVETLEKHPTTVAVGASEKRSAAAEKIDVLEPALDAAEAAQAGNSIEKMLCHQMAAVHFTALRLLQKSAGDKLQPGEVARFTNAAARMIHVYQNGCLVLQKLKTKGTQRVIVQYQQVNVNEGGQAVVAGKVGTRARRGPIRKKSR